MNGITGPRVRGAMKIGLPLLSTAFALLAFGCDGTTHCEHTIDVTSVDRVRVPPGTALDVPVIHTTHDGPLHVTILSGVLPAGLDIVGTRLVGTPTEAASATLELEVTSDDPNECARRASLYLQIEPLECVSEQACHARSFAEGTCTRSADCTDAARHCVEILDGEGVCLRGDVGCGSHTRAMDYVNVEGITFTACGSDLLLVCEEPGYCD